MYYASLSNDFGIFDHKENFSSAQDALDWADGREGLYVIHIGQENKPGLSFNAECKNGEMVYSQHDTWAGWKTLSTEEIIAQL